MTDSTKLILDACCGGKMMWFNKNHPNALYIDIRSEDNMFIPGRPEFSVEPDEIVDFRSMHYPDGQFKLVVFDPPHLKRAGKNGWMAKKYGVLGKEWPQHIKQGFDECMRVLSVHGTLIFKWNEYQIPVKEVVAAIGQ
jgi:hypothetical protein